MSPFTPKINYQVDCRPEKPTQKFTAIENITAAQVSPSLSDGNKSAKLHKSATVLHNSMLPSAWRNPVSRH